MLSLFSRELEVACQRNMGKSLSTSGAVPKKGQGGKFILKASRKSTKKSENKVQINSRKTPGHDTVPEKQFRGTTEFNIV